MRIKNVFLFFIFLGFCFFTIGVISGFKTLKLEDNGMTANGLVISMDKERRDGGYVYRPIVLFTDHKGEERKLVTGTATFPPAYFEGEEVKIIYDPEDPKYPINAKIKDFWGLYSTALFMCGFGLFFILASAVSLYIYWKGGAVPVIKDPSHGYKDV